MKYAVVNALHSLYEANSIFRSTDFNDDGVPDNIGIKVKYIIIIEDERSPMNVVPRYSKTAIDGRLYLFRLSHFQILADVCLGVAFSAQPFLFRALGMLIDFISCVTCEEILRFNRIINKKCR